MPKAPLRGFRIIDLTMYVSGPFCTQLLAGLGAEVIKVERPPTGDVYRRQGPEFIGEESITFLSLNKGKKSIVVDLKHPDGAAVMKRLLERADALVHNFKPGTAERLGLGQADVAEISPGLIWACLSGYGGKGPKGELGGYDLMMQAETGIMEGTGHPDRPPAKAGYAVVDLNAGVTLALGLVAALLSRERTGHVLSVESSLYETAIAMSAIFAERYLSTGAVPSRSGAASPLFSPYEAYRTADGYVTVEATGPTGAFVRFCTALGLPDLANRAEFSDNATRVANQEQLRSEIEAVTTLHPTQHWISEFVSEGLPCAPIQSVGEALESDQTRALDLVAMATHPRLGTYRTIRNPLRFGSETTSKVDGAPLLGQHTFEVLQGLAFSEQEIQKLVVNGVVSGQESDA